jgi:hypothetical protein
MKTSELTGAALDRKVHDLLHPEERIKDGCTAPQYSTDWAQGGPIIEREKIAVLPDEFSFGWEARTCHFDGEDEDVSKGETPLIAAMRCYVASKLGDEVEIPVELTKGESK